MLSNGSMRERAMKAKEFRGLVEQLGELSAVQREALVAALSTKGSRSRQSKEAAARCDIDHHLVPLAAPLPEGAEGRDARDGRGHRRGRRDFLPVVGQGLAQARRAGAEKARSKAKKPGLSDEFAPVLIIRDRHGATTDAVLPDPRRGDHQGHSAPGGSA